jgi:tetratricopeptide (TPR) repeat protein
MTEEHEAIDALIRTTETFLSEARYEEASVAARDILLRAEALSAKDSVDLIQPLILLGRALAEQAASLSVESAQMSERASAVAIATYGAADVRAVRVLHDVSLSLRRVNLIDRSVDASLKALDIAEAIGETEESLRIMRVVTSTMLGSARYSEALELCARLQGREEERASGPIFKIIAAYQLGICLLRLGHRRRALGYLERARELRLKERPDGKTTELDELVREARGD